MCSTVVGTLDRGTKRDQQESVYIHTYLLFFFFSKIVQPSKRFVPGLSGNPGNTSTSTEYRFVRRPEAETP